MASITIIDGGPGEHPGRLGTWLESLTAELERRGHRVRRFPVEELKVRQCRGCWSCWVRTPGECVIEDDGRELARAVVGSHLVIGAAPLVMGFPGYRLKRALDRLVPIISPYVELVEGECRHVPRYERYPDLALVLEPETDTDPEDLEIVEGIFRRSALNLRAAFRFLRLTDTPPREVADEIGAA